MSGRRRILIAPLRNSRCPEVKNRSGIGSGQERTRIDGAKPTPPGLKGSPVSSGEMLREAIAAQTAGRFSEAEALCKKLLACEPQNLPAKHLRAIIAATRGNIALAITLLREVLQRDPASIGALNQLAGLYWEAGKSQEAIALCGEAIRLAPNSAETHDNLGLAFLVGGKHAEAAAAFGQALALKPDFGNAYCHLVIAHDLMGRPKEASIALRQAFSAGHMPERNAADVFRLIGKVLQRVGQFGEATRCFQRAIALQPLRTAPYLDMANGKKMGEADRALIGKMRELLGDPQLSDSGRANLHFALGKAFDDLSAFGDAIAHFDEANRLMRAGEGFDRVQHLKTIDWIIATFTKERCARHAAGASQDQTPIIVFGMPRSGTTLVERILSSHPEIGAGGELSFWGGIASTLSPQFTGFTAAAATAVAQEYLSLLAGVAPGSRRVTDKMPSNFFRLGLIHEVFPRARLIHCRRNAADTCLSVYFTRFETGHDYASDHGNIVFYYRQYERLMEHWLRALPADRMIEIDYEELVSNPEKMSRRMVEFCGLEWNESCLRPESNSGWVNTASMWQARQTIYTSSRERWRNYEPWLGEFRTLLPPARSGDQA